MQKGCIFDIGGLALEAVELVVAFVLVSGESSSLLADCHLGDDLLLLFALDEFHPVVGVEYVLEVLVVLYHVVVAERIEGLHADVNPTLVFLK